MRGVSEPGDGNFTPERAPNQIGVCCQQFSYSEENELTIKMETTHSRTRQLLKLTCPYSVCIFISTESNLMTCLLSRMVIKMSRYLKYLHRAVRDFKYLHLQF